MKRILPGDLAVFRATLFDTIYLFKKPWPTLATSYEMSGTEIAAKIDTTSTFLVVTINHEQTMALVIAGNAIGWIELRSLVSQVQGDGQSW